MTQLKLRFRYFLKKHRRVQARSKTALTKRPKIPFFTGTFEDGEQVGITPKNFNVGRRINVERRLQLFLLRTCGLPRVQTKSNLHARAAVADKSDVETGARRRFKRHAAAVLLNARAETVACEEIHNLFVFVSFHLVHLFRSW